MKAKNIRVRLDPNTGNLWLVEERIAQPIKRIKDITGDVLLALSADIVAEDGTTQVVRETAFSDGTRIRITIDEIGPPAESATPEGT